MRQPHRRPKIPKYMIMWSSVEGLRATAGVDLASPLSADRQHSVLVLEAGYSDSRQLWSRSPFAYSFKKDADWGYETVPI